MKTLIVINYQREIPPFMQMELKIAASKFDKIYYTSPSISNPETIDEEKITLLTFRKSLVRLKQYACGLLSVLKPSFWKEVKRLGLSVKTAKTVGKEYFCIAGTLAVARPIIKKHLMTGDDVTVLSSWFDNNALAASILKEEFPRIKAYSLAHAFEIDAKRCPILFRTFTAQKFAGLDGVYFISREKKNQFFRDIDKEVVTDENLAKSHVTYIGSLNEASVRNEPSSDGVFRILTCSRTSPEKRLHLLCETLRVWPEDATEIEWTHLGDGPLQEEITHLASQIHGKNVSIVLAGGKSHAEVLDFLANMPVDLFVNVSSTEGLPVSIMEAISFGIPVAATDVGGTRELVSDRVGYLLAEDFSPAELCDVLVRFASLAPSEREEYRNNAYKLWQEQFNANITINRFFDEII